MSTPSQLLLRRVAARNALEKGVIDHRQYCHIVEEIEEQERNNDKDNKYLRKEVKSRLLGSV
jgi:RNA processing factor Prp31